MLSHHWYASETPLKWRFAVGTMMARIGPILVIFDPLINYISKKNWTPSEKNFLDPRMVFITCKHRPDATDHKRKCLLVSHIV